MVQLAWVEVIPRVTNDSPGVHPHAHCRAARGGIDAAMVLHGAVGAGTDPCSRCRPHTPVHSGAVHLLDHGHPRIGVKK